MVNDVKQKVLLPTLRENQRYLVYELILTLKSKNFKSAHDQIIDECQKMLGIFDGAKAGLQSAKFEETTSRGIIRVNSRYVDKLKVCLGLIKNINNQPASINCLYVSGLLNKAKEKLKD